MSNQRNVAVFIGSLRKESFSRKMVNALITLAPPSLKLELIETGHLSFYNQDFDPNPPAEWVAFRQRVKAADAVLFVTCEYNRSTPPVLKNALDIGSRPYGEGVWNRKPGAVISVSPSALGGFGANHHLRQSLTFVNVMVLQQPEAYLGGVDKVMDDTGKITNDGTREFLANYMKAFGAWIDVVLA